VSCCNEKDKPWTSGVPVSDLPNLTKSAVLPLESSTGESQSGRWCASKDVTGSKDSAEVNGS